MPLEERPLEGEHDCRLGLPLEAGSTDEDRGLGAPGLPLVVDSGLSGSVVLKLGGASSEKPGISDGFHGLDFTVGEGPGDDGTACLDITGADLEIEDVLTEGADTVGTFDGVDGRRVGVDDLDVDLDAGKVGLVVGVEDLAVDLDRGVEDLDGIVVLVAGTVVVLLTETAVLDEETTGLAEETEVLVVAIIVLVEGMVVREVGVEGLDDFETVDNVGRPVGVADLDPRFPDDEGLLVPPPEEVNPGEEAGCLDTKLLLPASSNRFPDDEGLLIPPLEEVNPGEEAGCLDTMLLLLPVCSDGGFANLAFNDVERTVGAPGRLITVFVVSISREGKRGVPGGDRSHS